MALTCVTGPMGAGKSYYAVRKAAEALEGGKVVITNFRMTPDWHEKVCDRHLLRWLIPGRRRNLKREWRRRCYVVPDLKTLLRVRVDGHGEGRAVVLIDEGHVFLNARSWKADDRQELVDWISATRKLGIEVYIITQDLQSIDRQVRDRLTYHVQLRNLKQFKVMGISLLPFNFFLAVWQYHSAGKARIKTEAYRLTWLAKLYDTYELGMFNLNQPKDVIQLPAPSAGDAPAGTAPGRATSGAAAGAARRDPLDAHTRRLLEIGHDVAESGRNSQPDQKSQE